MKRLSSLAAIAFLLSILPSVPYAFAQEQLKGSVKHTFIPLASDNKVDIYLNGLAEGTPWYVAAVSSTDTPASIKADILSAGMSIEPRGEKHLSSLDPVPPSAITVSPGGLKVDVRGVKSPAIYLKVPTGTYLAVHYKSATIGGSVTPHLIIRNGKIDPDFAIDNFGDFLGFLHSPDIEQPDITPRPNGENLVSVAFAKKHLVNNPRPTVSVPPSNKAITFVKLTIDSSGKVVALSRMRGDASLFQQIYPTLSSWTFSPFSIPSTSAPGTVILAFPIRFDNGLLRSPFF